MSALNSRLIGFFAGLAFMALAHGVAYALASTPYTTNYVWDSRGRLILSIQADPGTGVRVATRYTYDLDSQLIETDKGTTTQANGSDFTALESTTISYDAAGNAIQKVVVNGANGSTSAPNAISITQSAYDADDRELCVAVRQNPSVYGALPTSACAQSTPAGVASPFGADLITEKVYDAAGQVTQEIHGLGTSLQQAYASYTYSLNGKMLSELDANNNLTSFIYDAFDRLATEQFPVKALGANTSDPTDYEAYTYDASGNKLSLRRRDGNVITYSYDALNRQITKTVPTEPTVTTTYDLADHTLGVLYGSTTGTSVPYAAGTGVTYGYDIAGRMISESSFGQTLGYGYDAAGNRTCVIWPDGFQVFSLVDPMNRVSQIVEVGQNPTCVTAAPSAAPTLATFVYDSLSRRQTLTRGNQTVTGYNYDFADRLTGLSHTFPSAPTSNIAYSFQYSPANQVSQKTASNPAYTWLATLTPFQLAARTSNGLNEDAAIAAVSNGYDVRGNLTFDGVRTFSYDIENRLLSESGPVSASLNYDPLGRLNQTKINGTTTNFLYSGPDLMAEYDGSGNVLCRYVHGPGTDEPLVWYQGSGVSNKAWLHQDRQGSVIAVSNASGAIQETDTYGPYGEPNNWSGSRFRYTGQIMLPELQLYHYKARVYDPIMGRFLQTDPIGYKDGPDWYLYVHNDPVNKTDPTGNDEVDVFRPFLGGYAYHEAEFVGNDKTGWTYISKDGAVGGGALGPSKYTIISVPSLKSGLESAAKQGYTSGYHHDASPTQDAANVKAATAEAKKDYNVATCNCGQAVGAGERAAGTPGYSGSSPNPKDAAKFEASPQGRQAGWTPVVIPTPPPPPKPVQQQ